MKLKHKQTGGTILGIIIGLVIGLSIAVVVAITINKMPVPFVNRMKQDKPVDPAPSQKIDLNKSLYGNQQPAKEAAKEFAKETEPTDPTAPDEKTDKQPAAKDAKTANADKPAADTKEKGKDAAKPDAAKPDAAKTDTAKADAGDDKWTYYLQAGAFRDQTDAENAKAKLALLGVETKISERNTENGTLYRVRVGPFGQVDAMNKVRTKLSENGVDVAVVRIPK
jgi:cell division protein FtsN